MLLLDSNVWVAQVFPTHRHHTAAAAVLNSVNATRQAVFCRATELSFLRLVSTPTIQRMYTQTSITNDNALAMLNHLLSVPGVEHREEPGNLVPLWHQLATRDSASPKLWMDAYLASFAIAGGFTLVTLDSAFSQFVPTGLSLELLVAPTMP